MKKGKIIFFVVLLLMSIHIISWRVAAKNILFEKSAKHLLDKNFLNQHKFNNIYIISKYYGKYKKYRYNLQIPDKYVVNIDTKEEMSIFLEDERERLKKGSWDNCFIEIDIVDYNLLYAVVDSYYSAIDINNEQIIYIWSIFGWVRLKTPILPYLVSKFSAITS